MAPKDASAAESYLRIREFDPVAKDRLRARALRNGRSMSAEAVAILRAAVALDASPDASPALEPSGRRNRQPR